MNGKTQFKTATDIPAGQCFVLVPGLSGRYMRTHIAVAHVACPYPSCRAVRHEPCKGPDGNYHSETHYMRRNAYRDLVK